MPPRGLPPTRAQCRAQSANPRAQLQAIETPEGNVQTLPNEESSVIPNSGRLPSPVPVPLTDAIPTQLQAVIHLLDVLERRSQGMIQQKTAAIAQVVAIQPVNRLPASPPQTAVSGRHQTPPPSRWILSDTSSVRKEKRRGKPPTLPSPPSSSTPANSDNSSSDSSSS